MKGCRPLSDSEIESSFKALKSSRDKALFAIMLYTGFRITEVLSLKIDSISESRIKVLKRNTKGKIESRDSYLHPDLKTILASYTSEYKITEGLLFPSIKNKECSISRIQAWRLIRPAMPKGMNLGLHSLRKVFAEKMYNSLDKDIFKVYKALGHKSIQNTVSYLSFKTDEVDNAIINMIKLFDK